MAESIFDRDRRIRASSLTMGPKFLLVTLNTFVGNNGDAWPSQTAIATAMSTTTRSVQKWQRELEARGVISVEVGCGRSSTNRYRLNLDCLAQNEEPRSALNGEPRSLFTGTDDAQIANHVRVNSEPRSPLMANHVRTERTLERTKKEQAFSFPENLRTPEFEDAWSEWVRHRREIRKKLTPSTIGKQLRQLATWGPSKAVRAIESSIANGWTGLFDPDGKRGSGGTVADPAAETAWESVLAALRKHSHHERGKVQAALDEHAWRALRAIGCKRVDESSDHDRKELRQRFITEFLKTSRGAA